MSKFIKLENGSKGLGEGNTSSSPLGDKKRINASKYWCFTYNNYKEEDVGSMARMFSDFGEYLFAKEVGESGTPHLQGWVGFKSKQRPIECFSKCGDWVKNIHWEKQRGNKGQAIGYCLKGNGDVFSNFDYSGYKPRVVEDRMVGKELYEWQKEILEMIKGKPDERKIFWYVDVVGGIGKTTFCHHIALKYKNAAIFSGKAEACKYALVKRLEENKPTDICIFDIARCQDEKYISYQSIEDVKNGLFFNTKYESVQFVDNIKHVIIFANMFPDESKLSKDRWVIKEIS